MAALTNLLSSRRLAGSTPLASTLLAGGILAAALALGGCADAITFSRTETIEGRTLIEEGDADGAAVIFANMTRRNPRDHRAHYYLGVAKVESGRPREAIRSFRDGLSVMELTPHGRADDHFRALLVEALSGALADHDVDGSQLAQIEKLSKGNTTLKLLVAMTHAKAGRPDNAISAFEAATSLDRRNPEVAKQYGLYLESLQQEEAATKTLRRAYALNTTDEEVAAALTRLGIVPGPSLLSRIDLATPALPLGPLPEIRVAEQPEANPDGQTPDGTGTPSTPPTAPGSGPTRDATLN